MNIHSTYEENCIIVIKPAVTVVGECDIPSFRNRMKGKMVFCAVKFSLTITKKQN